MLEVKDEGGSPSSLPSEFLQQLHLQEEQQQVQLKQQQVGRDPLIIDLVEAILTILCLFGSL